MATALGLLLNGVASEDVVNGVIKGIPDIRGMFASLWQEGQQVYSVTWPLVIHVGKMVRTLVTLEKPCEPCFQKKSGTSASGTKASCPGP